MINIASKGEDESNFQFGDVDSLHWNAVNKKHTGREIGLNHRKEELLRLILGSKEFETHPGGEDKQSLGAKAEDVPGEAGLGLL